MTCNESPRGFRGIWIPAEVWLDERLGALDKIILAEIDSLDHDECGCFASNQSLAAFCRCSERKVSESISLLKQCGYIAEESFDGRRRVLRGRLTKIRAYNYNNEENAVCPAPAEPVKADNIDFKKYEKTYNTICTNLSKVKYITDSRRSAIRTYEKTFTFEQFEEICRRANRSDFLCGKNTANNWKADFDFLIKPKSAVKVLEGAYDNPHRTPDIPRWN